MGSDSIAKRVARIRLPINELAKLTNFNELTVGRAVAGRPGTRNSTTTAIETALTAQEIALRDYLLDLHPLERKAVA